jgi:hypothetical protein
MTNNKCRFTIARMKKMTAWIGVMTLVLAACGGNAAPTGDPAARVTEYLNARVKPDVDKMIGLSCGAWEPNARLEAQSTQGRNAALEGAACSVATSEGTTAFVACTGKITTSYNGETRDFNLAERQFKLVAEGGEWRMCGYK